MGTWLAEKDIQEDAAVIDQVDAEVDGRLRRVRFGPDGSSDVTTSQRTSLVTMAIAAHQSHRELSEWVALEGLDSRDLAFAQILLAGGSQPADEIVGEEEG